MAKRVRSFMDFKEVLGMSLFPFFASLFTDSFMQPSNPLYISYGWSEKLYIYTVSPPSRLCGMKTSLMAFVLCSCDNELSCLGTQF